MRRKLLVFVAVLLTVAGQAQAESVLERARARGTLVAATYPQLPTDQAKAPPGGSAIPESESPSAENVTPRMQGFDVEVTNEIARRLGLPVKLVAPGWNEILAGNWDGRFDYAVASITPTHEREQRLLFPAVYRFDAAALVVRKDDQSITRPADASGKIIGVRRGTTFEDYLQHHLIIYGNPGAVTYLINDPKVRAFDDRPAVIQALLNHKVDAIVTSLGLIEPAIDQGTPVRIVQGFLFFEPVAVAVDKSDPEFAKQIGAIVTDMRRDGTLSNLSEKWFGVDVSGIVP